MKSAVVNGISSITVPSAEVEIAAYSLLTYVSMGDVAAALPIVKWLSKQRNALGGFSSTQVCLSLLNSLRFRYGQVGGALPEVVDSVVK